MNVSGPDVTTTCGQYGRVLTVGASYIAGIGGPCFIIDPWSTYDSYTSDDIQLLEGLRDGGITNCSKSTSTTVRSSDTTHTTHTSSRSISLTYSSISLTYSSISLTYSSISLTYSSNSLAYSSVRSVSICY